jgi:hypothetical protein
MRRALFVFCALAACGDDDEPAECQQIVAADYAVESGWETTSYAPTPTELGCYPYRASATESFGAFLSMRTNSTPTAGIDSCETAIDALNCGTYSGPAGTLTFHIGSADRLSMKVTGKLNGIPVDTMFYFNPCQPGCLAAVTLKTIDDAQQKVCEIPSQNAVCLFPDTAHTITFGRIGLDSVELRLAGQTYPLARSN